MEAIESEPAIGERQGYSHIRKAFLSITGRKWLMRSLFMKQVGWNRGKTSRPYVDGGIRIERFFAVLRLKISELI